MAPDEHPVRSLADPGLLLPLAALLADYWYDVDHHWGRGAHLMYAGGGRFSIGPELMDGIPAIRAFYTWREGRGAREARHVISNLRVRAMPEGRVQVDCILCLYAADGVPVLESRPPILIADETADCEQGSDGVWRFVSHTLRPVFAGGAPITTPPRATP
ncbi:MAG: hypothetical protein JWQ72_2463 [Polaromonas sp.]|nr:hypothetical protein [Polaromonas sp.]